MLYKTPKHIDAKVLNLAKQELAEQNTVDFLNCFKLFITLFSDVFLSNYKNLFLNITNIEDMSFKRFLISAFSGILGLVLPVSPITFHQVKISSSKK